MPKVPKSKTQEPKAPKPKKPKKPPKPRTKICTGYCGVYQCRTARRTGVPFFRLPLQVRENPKLLRKWAELLHDGHPFKKSFTMCRLHFERDQILQARDREGIRTKPHLIATAFPTLNLPIFDKKPKNTPKSLSEPVVRVAGKRSNTCEEDPLDVENDNRPKANEKKSNQLVKRKHIAVTSNTKRTVVNVAFSNLCDTDSKLKAMTGLDDKTFLDALANECLKSSACYKENNMAMRDKIILTMFKLKTNVDFIQLAAFFQISETTAQKYFIYTVKSLAKIFRSTIQLQSREQVARSSPPCFNCFPNFRLFLECIEIKSNPSVKAVIGYAPSGLINYVNKVLPGKFSDRAVIQSSTLLRTLDPEDTIMVDRDLYFTDSVHKIDVIYPGKIDYEKNKSVIELREHFEKHIPRFKTFKILSEKIESLLTPLIDDILTVLCGLSNKSLCISIE